MKLLKVAFTRNTGEQIQVKQNTPLTQLLDRSNSKFNPTKPIYQRITLQ